MDSPAGAGGTHPDRGRHGPQRQQGDKPDHSNNLRDRSGSSGNPDRSPRPAVLGRDLGEAGDTASGDAGVDGIGPKALMSLVTIEEPMRSITAPWQSLLLAPLLLSRPAAAQ